MSRRFFLAAGVVIGTMGCSSIDAAGARALARDTVHPLEVYVWREDVEGAFRRDASPVARGLSSLHPVIQDGQAWSPVLQSISQPTWLEEAFPSLRVAYLTSQDRRAWEFRTARVAAPGRSLIDPAFVAGPDGLELWFVQNDAEGDPAHAGGNARIVRTRWDGAAFVDAQTWWTGTSVLDPAPVFHDGRWRVFATQGWNVVELAPEGRTIGVLQDATVPWAFVGPEGLGLLAQRMRDGKMLPIEAHPSAGGWTDAPVPLRLDAASQGTRTCASPGWVSADRPRILLCVDETTAHGDPGRPIH